MRLGGFPRRPQITAARRDHHQQERQHTMATKKVPATIAEVRAWGRDNGFTVAAKGRLSAELTTAFTKATKRTIATPATV